VDRLTTPQLAGLGEREAVRFAERTPASKRLYERAQADASRPGQLVVPRPRPFPAR
jgi:hypothetical protein